MDPGVGFADRHVNKQPRAPVEPRGVDLGWVVFVVSAHVALADRVRKIVAAQVK